MIEVLRQALDAELPRAYALRRQIHEDPHVSGDEAGTRDLVLEHLPVADGIEVAGTGAIVRVGGPGPAVAIRAELDALPVVESTGSTWASRTAGVMHACGHDVHLAATAALAGAVARIGRPPLLVVLQPREETAPSGALDVLASGLLEGGRAMIGAHVQPQLLAGTISATPGFVNASADEFTVTVHGRGGHAAYPHTLADPVGALAHIVVALQGLPHRVADPTSTTVLSVTRLMAGTAANVVPDTAVAAGTLRTSNDTDRRRLLDGLTGTATAIATAHGCTADIAVVELEPPLINDSALAAAAGSGLRDLGYTVVDDMRSAGSDDFAHYCRYLPSLMMFVGVAGGGRLHSATFLPPDEAVRDVAYALLAGYCAGTGER